jgi:hypothetical protein
MHQQITHIASHLKMLLKLLLTLQVVATTETQSSQLTTEVSYSHCKQRTTMAIEEESAERRAHERSLPCSAAID